MSEFNSCTDLSKSSDEDEDEEFEDAVTETDDQFVVAPSNDDISASEVKVTPSINNTDETADLYGYVSSTFCQPNFEI